MKTGLFDLRNRNMSVLRFTEQMDTLVAITLQIHVISIYCIELKSMAGNLSSEHQNNDYFQSNVKGKAV